MTRKPNARRRTAIHEAAHAVIGRALRQVCGPATIVPNRELGEAGHAITADPYETLGHWLDVLGRFRGADEMRSIVRARIMTYMAGREAEEVFFGSCAGGDDEDRRQIALMFDSYPPVATGTEPGEYPIRYEQRLRARTRWLVRRHRAIIERIAKMLLESGTLRAEELDAACESSHGSKAADGRASSAASRR